MWARQDETSCLLNRSSIGVPTEVLAPERRAGPLATRRTVTFRMAFRDQIGVKTVMKELPSARTALRIAAAVAVGATAIQFVIWLLIALIGRHLESPWWMWTLLAAGVLAGAAQLLKRPRDVAEHRSEADTWSAR